MKLTTGVVEIATPASVGWEWEHDGARYQVAWIRHTPTLLFAMKPSGRSDWSATTTMAKPRWEVSPQTVEQAREVANRFIQEGLNSALAFG
jgi:hypothetical protein